MKFSVSFTVQGDDHADELYRLWPTLNRRQSAISKRVAPDLRWINFDGDVCDLPLLVEHFTAHATSNRCKIGRAHV